MIYFLQKAIQTVIAMSNGTEHFEALDTDRVRLSSRKVKLFSIPIRSRGLSYYIFIRTEWCYLKKQQASKQQQQQQNNQTTTTCVNCICLKESLDLHTYSYYWWVECVWIFCQCFIMKELIHGLNLFNFEWVHNFTCSLRIFI